MGVAVLAESQAAVLGRDLDPKGADLTQAFNDLLGNLSVPIDLVAIHPLLHETLEPRHERTGALKVGGIGLREGMHQVEPERSLEQLPHEARRLPFLLPRGLGNLSGFLLGGERWLGARSRVRKYVSHGSKAQ